MIVMTILRSMYFFWNIQVKQFGNRQSVRFCVVIGGCRRGKERVGLVEADLLIPCVLDDVRLCMLVFFIGL